MTHQPTRDTEDGHHARATKARRFLRVILAALALAVCADAADAQETAATPAPRTSAEEDFELNISERRITVADDYEASTAVEVGDAGARGLNLRVGVALGANRIDVLLRNVRGRVRFRASLAPVLERLAPRTPPPPTPQQDTPAPPSP